MTEENKQELNPCLRMYDFFSHMSDYHGLTLTDTEMHDIISVCAKYADSKPEADILTTALDVAIAQRNDLNAEVEMLKADLRTERDHGIDTGCKISELEAEVERLRTSLSNADEEIIVLSEQRDDALAEVEELKEELEEKSDYGDLREQVAYLKDIQHKNFKKLATAREEIERLNHCLSVAHERFEEIVEIDSGEKQ